MDSFKLTWSAPVEHIYQWEVIRTDTQTGVCFHVADLEDSFGYAYNWFLNNNRVTEGPHPLQTLLGLLSDEKDRKIVERLMDHIVANILQGQT